MHVLYFHQHFSTREGATGTRSYEMAQRLLQRGHRVTMVCGSYDSGQTGLEAAPVNGLRSGVVDGVEVIEICLPYSNRDGFLKRSLTFLRFAAKSVSIALTRDYDLLFATSTPLTAGIPGIIAKALRRQPFVFEIRDLWPELPKAMGVIRNPLVLKAMAGLEWLSYHSADALIALSPGMAHGIERRGIPSARIAIIPNGCDLELFHPLAEKTRPFPGVSTDDFVAIFTGAHGIANGLDAVLDAAAVLKARGRSEIKLVLIGQGKLKPALVARAEREGLDNCLFLDPVPKRQVAEVTASADAGLMVLSNVPAFYHGTSPNKFFDYIASGLPVVNNYPGWLAEMIAEQECGIAVPPENPEAFAEALITLADDRAEARRIGERGRRLAECEFAREKLADQFVDWLEQAAVVKDAEAV